MKYAVIRIVNGNFAIHSEGWTDITKARMSYFSYLSALYNDLENVDSFCVMIMHDIGGILEMESYSKPENDPAIEGIPAEVEV